MDSDDAVSLNSTEPEDYGDKLFIIRSIHAEKTDEDGTKKWLVAWDGWSSDDDLWLPKEAFTDEASLEEWEAKKKKIEKGLVEQYPWREWDRRQRDLEHQRAIDKKRHQELRIQKRKDRSVIRRNGKWLDLRREHHPHDSKRARSSSDESYVDEDNDDIRPLKRTITEIYSDSDDDRPLISVQPSTVPAIGRPDTTRLGADKGKGVADHRTIFNLPIRMSQSPLPTDRSEEGVMAATNKHKAAEVERIQSKHQAQGKSILTVTDQASTSSAAPQPLRTAMRSSKPKSQSQSIFNIPKRVLDKRSTPSSASRKTTMPVAKDFHTNMNTMWASNNRGRNEPAPRADDLHLVSIPSATHDRGRQFNRLAAENVEPDQLNARRREHSRAPTATLVPQSGSGHAPAHSGDGVQRSSGIGNSRGQTVEEMMDIDLPTTKDSGEKEPSLFVGDSQEPIDEATRTQTQRSALQNRDGAINTEANNSSILTGRIVEDGSSISGRLPNHVNSQSIQHRLEAKEVVVPNAPDDNLKLSVDLFSDRGKQVLEECFNAAASPSYKIAQLQSTLAQSSCFSSNITEEQKARILKEFVDWILKQSQSPAASTTPLGDATTSKTRDPRLLRRQSNAAASILPNLLSPPQQRTIFSFQQAREQYQKGEPYTPESAISMFKKLFHIDWVRMTGGKHVKIPVMIVYPLRTALAEQRFLEDGFLSWSKARAFLLNNQDWKAFRELIAPRPQHIDKSGNPSVEVFDPKKHAKLYTGAPGILLMHESVDDLSRFRYIHDLWMYLRNPNFRIFRISLGEPYQTKTTRTIPPGPGVQELAKEGQHILITDSVFVSHPYDALRIFEYLNVKLQAGNSLVWKIYTRPKLVSWLLRLYDNHQEDPRKQAAYAEIHAYINKLVPFEQRRHTHLEYDWIPTATAALDIPSTIEGYKFDAGLASAKDEDTDLAYNDELLVNKFDLMTQKLTRQVRFFMIVLSDRRAEEKGKDFNTRCRHVRIMSSTGFVGMGSTTGGQVRSALLQAEWEQTAGKQTDT